MDEFEKIIKEDVYLFDKKFKEVLSTNTSILYKITNYIRKNSGKRIRPICCLIASGLVNNITEKTFRGAILIELLHTATLIHDDIVDDAQIRRSQLSINAVWKNKIAVLTGDYFLAKGLSLAVINKDYDILEIVSNVVQKIVEGELLQIEKTKKLNLTELDYFKIINLKTGSLFECAFQVAGISSNVDQNMFQELTKLGNIIGQLFQIKDDVLDYYDQKFIGKNSGNDIKEGKINLPLLYSLNKMSLIEKSQVFNILRKKIKTRKEIDFVQGIVLKHKGLDYAKFIIDKNYKDAISILENFENGKYKKSIYLLLTFLVERNK